MKRTSLIILLGLISMLMATGCSKKVIKPESHFDTVISHYDQGKRELEAGRLDRARWEFERANGIDDKQPLPYVGLALVETKEGNRDKARDMIGKALDRDDKCVPAHLASAEARSTFKKDDDWYEKALKDVGKAAKIEPKRGEIYCAEGFVHEAAFMLDPAEKSFSKVLELKSGCEETANHELEKIHKIKRAAPGSKIGIKIGLVEKINRAETAVLFVEELKLIELIQKRTRHKKDTSFSPPDDPREMKTAETVKMAEATDIEDHWAKNYVQDILEVSVRGLTAYPDHTFRPNELLTRAEYALLMEDIMIKAMGDNELATKFIGQTSAFHDVGSSHPAFNAINVCVDKGIMKAALNDNSFRPMDSVSGADALLIIKALQDELRTDF